LSLVNSVLFITGSNWSFFLGLGVTRLVDEFGDIVITGTTGHVLALGVDIVIAGILAGLGLLSRSGTLWSFIVGTALLVLDGLFLAVVTDWGAVAFHGLALFFIIRGIQAARRLAALRTSAAMPSGIVPPITPR
jgi:hypothetical protein